MEDSQKLDYILANAVMKEDITKMAAKEDIADLVTKTDIAILAIRDDLAEMRSDILTEIDRNQGRMERRLDCLEEDLDSLRKNMSALDLIYKNMNLLRKSYIDLQSEVEVIGIHMS